MTTRGTEGSKYAATKDLSTTEIAKCIRGDLKAAVAAGELPTGIKLGVRTRYASMMSAIDVTIVALPDGFEIYNRERVRYDETNGKEGQWGNWMADSASALQKRIRAIVDAYNFDNSDPMVDYFHVRFYGSVDFSHDLQEADRARAVAELSAEQTATQQDFLTWALGA
jgi:hypothetical protein